MYFNPFTIDPPQEKLSWRSQPLRLVATWGEEHVAQADVWQREYLKEFRLRLMDLNSSIRLAWRTKFRLGINGWTYGAADQHGGATQDHVHSHFVRKVFSSEERSIDWLGAMRQFPNVRVGQGEMMPGRESDGSGDIVNIALEASGPDGAELDSAVSHVLERIIQEKHSFNVLYFELPARSWREWVGRVMRFVGLGPWLPASLNPSLRVLIAGRLKGQPDNATPLGFDQVVGLDNAIAGNPSRFYDLSEAQRAEFAATAPLQNQIDLINRWVGEGQLSRLPDKALYENFLSELQQTMYSRKMTENLLQKLLQDDGGNESSVEARPHVPGLSRNRSTGPELKRAA